MMQLLRDWILGLMGTAVVCAVATLLTPKGQVKRVVQLLCGAAMVVALVQPLLHLELSNYGLNLSKYRAGAEALTADAEELRQNLDRSIIEDKMQAYILDKAQSLGAAVEVIQMNMQWSTEGFWYPTAVEFRGEYNEALSRLIEAELGIPAQAQTWRTNENP